MTELHPNWSVKPFSAETWPAFEVLAAKHNGVWGGCWCTWFHGNTGRLSKEENNHDYKERLTKSGNAHAALVLEGDQAIAWCQFGSPAELPKVHSKRLYQSLNLQPPDYRITCFFVDTDYRKQGAATMAIQGALDMIAELGGGVVEAFPMDTEKKKISNSDLYVGSLGMFTKLGFELITPLSGNFLLVRRTINPVISKKN